MITISFRREFHFKSHIMDAISLRILGGFSGTENAYRRETGPIFGTRVVLLLRNFYVRVDEG